MPEDIVDLKTARDARDAAIAEAKRIATAGGPGDPIAAISNILDQMARVDSLMAEQFAALDQKLAAIVNVLQTIGEGIVINNTGLAALTLLLQNKAIADANR